MHWLVTGGAGFIGSNLVEALLKRGERVTVLDDLSSGLRSTVDAFEGAPGFRFIEGSVTDRHACREACEGADYVLHHAAMVSVPVSVLDPEGAAEINVLGTVRVFEAARQAGVSAVVWASSTAVYGDAATLPNVETLPLAPRSPYAASKAAGELFAQAYGTVYGMKIVGLRYFNVFGPRQNPDSAYAAAIPIFITRLLAGEPVTIHGDGGQTRDFVYIDNVVDANIRAATMMASDATGGVYNIGGGERISIYDLVMFLAQELGATPVIVHEPPRPGDVRDSLADISAARAAFGYQPSISVKEGIRRALSWYRDNAV